MVLWQLPDDRVSPADPPAQELKFNVAPELSPGCSTRRSQGWARAGDGPSSPLHGQRRFGTKRHFGTSRVTTGYRSRVATGPFCDSLGSPKGFGDEMSHQAGLVPLRLAPGDGPGATARPVGVVRAHSRALAGERVPRATAGLGSAEVLPCSHPLEPQLLASVVERGDMGDISKVRQPGLARRPRLRFGFRQGGETPQLSGCP